MKIYKIVRYTGGLAALCLTTLMPASAQDQAPAPRLSERNTILLPTQPSPQTPATRLSARDMIQRTRANIAEQASGAWLKAADQAATQMSDPAGAADSAEMADLGTAYDMAIENAGASAELSGAGREQALKSIQTATMRHQGTLSSVLDRVPNVAKAHIQHAMEVSQRGHDRAMQAIQNAGQGRGAQGQDGQGRGGQGQGGQGRDGQGQGGQGRGGQGGQNRGGDGQNRPNQGRPERTERENGGQGRGGQAGGQGRGGQGQGGQDRGGQGRGGQAGGQDRGGQGGQGRGGRR